MTRQRHRSIVAWGNRPRFLVKRNSNAEGVVQRWSCPLGCSPKKLVAGIRRVTASYPMPRSTDLQFRPPRSRQLGNSLPGKNERDGHRAFDAPALKHRTAEGAEAPYSGAPAVREYGAVLPTRFWGLHPLPLWGDNPQNWGSVIICLIANWYYSRTHTPENEVQLRFSG